MISSSVKQHRKPQPALSTAPLYAPSPMQQYRFELTSYPPTSFRKDYLCPQCQFPTSALTHVKLQSTENKDVCVGRPGFKRWRCYPWQVIFSVISQVKHGYNQANPDMLWWGLSEIRKEKATSTWLNTECEALTMIRLTLKTTPSGTSYKQNGGIKRWTNLPRRRRPGWQRSVRNRQSGPSTASRSPSRLPRAPRG